MAATEWREAPDLMEMAGPIIAENHPHLIGYPLKIVWRSKAKKAGHGKVAAGTATITSGIWASLVMTDAEKAMEGQDAGYKFFLIEIAEDIWESLSEKQRTALIDHELMHCGVVEDEETGEVKMVVLPHDRELFYAEIERHGLWDPALVKLGDTILSLPAP
ncbi:hypothetical protein EON81_06920 [bacterium]|nr:MAG: hypothetical protein EON81_06920 [bacterium]